MENKFKIGTEWKTRGGWRAVVVAYDEGKGFPITAWVESNPHSREDDIILTCEGKFFKECVIVDTDELVFQQLDLIEPWIEPVVHEGWVNVYGGNSTNFSACKEVADSRAYSTRIACIKVKFTEGENL